MATLLSSLQQLGNVDLATANEAVKTDLIGKCKDLIFALQSPERHVVDISINLAEVVVIRTIIRFGVLEVLPESDKTGISLVDLATKIKQPAPLLERLLRLLVGTRFIAQDSSGNYSHSTKSHAYLALPGAWFSGITAPVTGDPLWLYPTQYLDAHPDRPEPNSPEYNLFTFAYKNDGENMWATFPKDKLEGFQKGMSMVASQLPVVGVYDYSSLVIDDDGKRPLVVDVGGGVGTCLSAILNHHEDIEPSRCYLQDLASVLSHAPKDIKFNTMESDFFTPQPIKGAKAYFMRWIMHDYHDHLATTILKHVVDAMSSDSVLLINDAVVPERLDERSLHAGLMDIWMLVCGGKERTRKGWEMLLGGVGLRIKGVWMTPGTCQGVLECVKV